MLFDIGPLLHLALYARPVTDTLLILFSLWVNIVLLIEQRAAIRALRA